MRIFRARTVEEVFDAWAEEPDAILLAGGTDVMVAVNEGHLRPPGIIDLSALSDLATIQRYDDHVRIGATVTFTRLATEFADDLPALARAARTVGSPQIRNRATLGGNIGTASPAGDALPVLVAMHGSIVVASRGGRRTIEAREYFRGLRETALAPGELVVAVELPIGARSAQQFSKIGPRNAMVISVAALCIHVDATRRRVGTGLGSVGPTTLSAPEAENLLMEHLFDDAGGLRDVDDRIADEFARLVADAARPIDDHRATAAYRRHTLSAMARRTLSWTIDALAGGLP